MMGRNPVTIRYLISTICIVLFLWGCDSAAEPPAQPKVVRKKIVAEEKQTARVSKKKTVRTAKAPRAAKPEKRIAPAKVEKPMGEVKTPPVAKMGPEEQPLIAKKVGPQPLEKKKPAIKPKSDISEIKPPAQIQLPAAGKKSNAGRKLIAAASVASQGATGSPAKYDPTGKIDPFKPLFQDKPVLAKKNKRIKRKPQTPLERIDLSQLKLVGIILASSGNRALVEEASGKGYVIKKGTYIGINGGKIIKIKKEKVIVEEEFEDVFGKISTRQREIKLPKPPGEF
jgi:type IV pilus assembly protein PilP